MLAKFRQMTAPCVHQSHFTHSLTCVSSLNTYRSFCSSSRFSDDIVSISPWSSDHSTITRIKMNNPRKLNCLSTTMMLSLTDAINHVNNDPTLSKQTRVIILSGNGRIFSSGHDLKQLLSKREMNDSSLHNNDGEDSDDTLTLPGIFDICTNLMLTVRNSSIPIISMTHGWCAAAGLQLACASDLITSTNSCQFATPGVNIGLFCSTPSVELSRVIGNKHCMELLLTGNSINGKRAFEIGLINRVTKEYNKDDHSNELAELEDITLNLAKDIAKQSKAVISLGKKGFHQQCEMGNLKESHKNAGNCMVTNMYLKDCQEGIQSFIEKRKPQWIDE